MRRFDRWWLPGLAAGVVAGTSVPADAYLLEILDTRINEQPANVFLCPTPGNDSVPCNLWHRTYPDLDPTLLNGPAAPVDGFPYYRPNPQRYTGDAQITGNYPGANGNAQACEAWYGAWTGVVDPNEPTFIAYYGAASTIVNFSETGNSNFANCVGGNVNPIACMGALTSASATGTSPNTPLGTLSGVGGLEPVPVPAVTGFDGSTVSLSIPAAVNQTRVNLPSATQAPCPGGSTFDDLVETEGPPAIWGIRLFAHVRPQGSDYLSLADLEGSTVDAMGVLQTLGLSGDGLCFDDASCPDARVIPCDMVAAGNCTPDGLDFVPTEQQIDVDLATIEAVFVNDTPPIPSDQIVFNTKVVFAGGGVDSTASLSGITNDTLVSLFSANSEMIVVEEAMNGTGTTGGTTGTTGGMASTGDTAATTGGMANTEDTAATTGGMANTGDTAATTGGMANTEDTAATTGTSGDNASTGGAAATTGGAGTTGTTGGPSGDDASTSSTQASGETTAGVTTATTGASATTAAGSESGSEEATTEAIADDGEGCGCTTGRDSTPWLVVVLAATLRRRGRRRRRGTARRADIGGSNRDT